LAGTAETRWASGKRCTEVQVGRVVHVYRVYLANQVYLDCQVHKVYLVYLVPVFIGMCQVPGARCQVHQASQWHIHQVFGVCT